MQYVTSINPKARIEHQRMCIQTWFDAGASTVLSVQTRLDDMGTLLREFPRVEFVVTDSVGHMFARPWLPTIHGMMQEIDFADGNALLINSDIEVRVSAEEMAKEFAPPADRFRCMVRWDYNLRQKRIVKWGIDAFVITPEIRDIVPEDGMTVGCPVWDWWLPWVVCSKLSTKLWSRLNAGFMHRAHVQNWPNSQMEIGFGVMARKYGIKQHALANWVISQTKRLGVSGVMIQP